MRGDELTPWLIRHAYEQGIFPMTLEDGEVGWFEPRRRCLFPIEGIHVSRSLRRTLRSGRFRVTFDTAFEEVMRGCLREPGDNWISEEFIRVYTLIHLEGWGHSCEVWQGERLVGGVYGVAVGTCFCAESMFYRETDASKAGLHALVNRCREAGFTIFDAQVMNPHLASLGAFQISNQRYREMLEDALSRDASW